MSPEDALRRLQSQWPNSKQVEHANVVLSTLWEPEVTHKQVSHLSRKPFPVYTCALCLNKIRVKLSLFSFEGAESLESSSAENPAEARRTVGTCGTQARMHDLCVKMTGPREERRFSLK